jgi:hypothetical protein
MKKAKKKNTKKVKLYSKRIPLPQKPPKVEIPKKAYSRRKLKKDLKKLSNNE